MPDDSTRTASPSRIAASEPAAGVVTRDLHAPTGSAPDGAPERPAPLTPDGYELFEEVGAGGMGVVYRAREIALDRDVAVKLLQIRYSANSPSARRFLDEARITAQLQHPAIPPVHHVGTLPDGRPFLAMKLIKGETLADLLAREPLDRSRFIVNFAQVCQAVAYAHARKVIHRDLKPSNVMVGAFGDVQVMDWGLAKVLTDPPRAADSMPDDDGRRTEIRTAREPDSDTQAGSVLGTPAFMSPEQAGGEVGKIDERSDVFGLGAVLCAILTGKPPYDGPDGDSIRLKAIRGETGDALARLDSSGADPELVALCKRCLAADREERPRDADEVAKAVTDHLAAAEERARKAELDRIRVEERRKRRRVQFLLAASVIGLVVAASFAAFYIDRRSKYVQLYQRTSELLWKEEQARSLAENAKRNAEDSRQWAEKLLGDSRQAHSQLQEALRDVKQAREKLERVEYGRAMQVALQEWREHNVVSALTLLNSTRPDLRGWEWHYLHRLCHSNRLTLKGHTNVLRAASFNRDGSRIVTASWDKTARVWDAKSGGRVLVLEGHTGLVHSASFSTDGSRIVTASQDGTARVWDAKSGEGLLTLRGFNANLRSASFSPDGSRIVTAGGEMDRAGRIWDAKTGTELVRLDAKKSTVHHALVQSASFSPDGSRIVTAGHQATGVWDAKTGEMLIQFLGHSGPINSASFAPDGTRVVTAGADRTARVWDAKTGAALVTFKQPEGGSYVFSASFNSDGSRVVTAHGDGTARVWDAATGSELHVLSGHTSGIAAASFSPDDSRIVTGSYDLTARVWDAAGGMDVATFQPPAGHVSTTAMALDGTRFLTTSFDGTATVWDGAGKTAPITLKGDGNSVYAAAWSADGRRVVTGTGQGTSKVWDAITGADLLTLKGHTTVVSAMAFSPDGSRIITRSYNEPARIWDARTGAQLLTLEGRTGVLLTAAFSPDGTLLVTDSQIPAARVWDAKTGAVVATLKGHTYGVTAASFSPDGSRVLTASLDRTARVWDAKTGTEILVFRGHTASLRATAFSPDGSRIVTASDDRTVKIWDAATGAELLTLRHTGSVATALFSADGSRVLAASHDGVVKVWDARPVNRDFLPREQAPPPRARRF